MSTGIIEYLDLRELANENYSIIDGESDITGWAVVDEGNRYVGKVRDLLFDPKADAVRYVIVYLDGSVFGTGEKTVLLPIGFIKMGEEKKEVIIPVLHDNQISLMPQYIIGEVTRDTEVQIRSAIESPAALRMEEEIAGLEHSDFYQHHHFDRGYILSNKKEISHLENTAEPEGIDREEEQTTIHELIRSSRESGNDEANESSEVGNVKFFTVNTASGSFKVEPQENGTCRIFGNEEKIGVIYAEPGHDESGWRTMDQLNDSLVLEIGEAITVHNSAQSSL